VVYPVAAAAVPVVAVPAVAPLPRPAAPSPAVQAAIDQTLQVVSGESRRLANRLGPAAGPPPSLAQLRAGTLGQDLAHLALVAAGRIRESRERVLAAIDAVLQLLFWPAGADDYAVPRSFWATDLGRLLARAKFRAFAPADLVGIGAAARQLGVTRPTVYRWMDDGALDYVRDEVSGRSFVLRRGVDRYRQAAAELAAPA
jgi:excisionase family DNA binding protein